MRYVGIALISIFVGFGGGLLTYGLTQPSVEESASLLTATTHPNDRYVIHEIRRQANFRSTLMAIGVGFLSCGATAVALSFLKTVVDHNLRNRPGG
jgi:hypothetical protein